MRHMDVIVIFRRAHYLNLRGQRLAVACTEALQRVSQRHGQGIGRQHILSLGQSDRRIDIINRVPGLDVMFIGIKHQAVMRAQHKAAGRNMARRPINLALCMRGVDAAVAFEPCYKIVHRHAAAQKTVSQIIAMPQGRRDAVDRGIGFVFHRVAIAVGRGRQSMAAKAARRDEAALQTIGCVELITAEKQIIRGFLNADINMPCGEIKLAAADNAAAFGFRCFVG